MLGGSRTLVFALTFVLIALAPSVAADEYVRVVTPVQGPNDPDCATIGTSNYKGNAFVSHSIVGGGVWAIAGLATEDTSGSKVFFAAVPVNCLTGMDPAEIENHLTESVKDTSKTTKQMVLP